MFTRRISLFLLSSALLLSVSGTASAGGFSTFGRRFDRTTSLSPQPQPRHETPAAHLSSATMRATHEATTISTRPKREMAASSGRAPRLSTTERQTANSIGARGTLGRMTYNAPTPTTQMVARTGGVPHLTSQSSAQRAIRPAIRSAQPSHGYAAMAHGSLEPTARKRGSFARRLPTL